MEWRYHYSKIFNEALVYIIDDEDKEILAEVDKLDIQAWDKDGELVDFFHCDGETTYDFIFSVQLNTLEGVRFFSLWCEMEGYEEKTPTETGLWGYDENSREWTKK